MTWFEYGFEVDGGRVLLGWDDREDLDAFASLVAADHGLVGAGCHGDGSDTCAGSGGWPRRSGPRRSFLLRIGARGCPRGVLLRVRHGVLCVDVDCEASTKKRRRAPTERK